MTRVAQFSVYCPSIGMIFTSTTPSRPLRYAGTCSSARTVGEDRSQTRYFVRRLPVRRFCLPDLAVPMRTAMYSMDPLGACGWVPGTGAVWSCKKSETQAQRVLMPIKGHPGNIFGRLVSKLHADLHSAGTRDGIRQSIPARIGWTSDRRRCRQASGFITSL